MALSPRAGTDLNCGSYFRLHLKDAFDQGLVTMEDIDQAFKNLRNTNKAWYLIRHQ